MLKLLIVEDNAPLRQMLVESIIRHFPDVQILAAGQAEEALTIIEEDRPALILMDLRLPGENGLDLTRKIKMDHPGIAVIMLTSYDLPEYRQIAQELGVNHFLCKGATSVEQILELIHIRLSEQSGGGAMTRKGQDVPHIHMTT
jgi:DNA-binding NarL/FixJ family response regulator